MSTLKILLVEDEKDIRDLMSLHLSREGYQVIEAFDGEEALKNLQDPAIDLFVFDWMLPGMNGLELIRQVRSQRSTPVLMVTARAEGTDVVAGLESGADDYITKPFEIPVLLARVRALLRRTKISSKQSSHPHLIKIGQLSIDTGAHEVKCQGQAVALTPSEFKLLSALAHCHGKVMTRASLIDSVQGSDVNVVDRTVDTHVFGLRKKLGQCGDLIETVRGVGYRMQARDE